MYYSLTVILFLFGSLHFSLAEAQSPLSQIVSFQSDSENEAVAAFQYLLQEVELDDHLTFEERQDKVHEFKAFAESLKKEVADRLTILLLEETLSRIVDILQNAAIDENEMTNYLADFEKTISKTQNRNVEFARQMLFFVAELKIHRQLVHDFGIALGCPEKQLLRHDLCKLKFEQFEAYVRFFRGGRLDKDKPAYLIAWGHHQHEEHHHESYSKEGFDFDSFPEERLRNNMLEMAADWLAATKQRGGTELIDRLINTFSKHKPHPRIIPFFEEALIKAHTLYLENRGNPDSLFKDLPCWNEEVAEVFSKLKKGS